MNNKHTIVNSLALLLLCFYAVSLCLCRGKLVPAKAVSASEQSKDDAVETVLGILRSGDPDMQAAAITMVRELTGEKLTQALVAELPSLSTTVQVQLLSALADRGDGAALPAVISSTKSKETSIRVAALKALGKLGDVSSVTLLAETAAKSKSEEQKAARESLYRLRGSEVDNEILARISTADPNVKVEMIRSVGQRNITTGFETLLKTAEDPDSRVQQESFKALKIISNDNNLPALVEVLTSIKIEPVRSEAEKIVAAVALKIEDKNQRSAVVLAALPTVEDSHVRCSLLRVLGQIGEDNALPALRAALSSYDEAIRDTAVRALSDWPNPAAINDLLTIAKTTGNKTHKILALRGFMRIIGLESNRPAEEAIKMYKQVMELSEDVSEKRLILSGLSKVKSLSALEMAASYLQDSALQQEAEAAVVKIAENICAAYPRQTRDALNKIIQTSKNETLRKQAQDIMKQN
jgi:HEAT repeat protein